MVGPDYHRPAALTTPRFKEAPPGWRQAKPLDSLPKGDWWRIFNDPALDLLEQQAMAANQTIAEQAATYDQAKALVTEARAGLYPVLGVSASATRTGGGNHTPTTSLLNLSGNASWEPDFWGRVRRQVESNVASAQASAADLVNAKLSAGASLATAYMELTVSDALQRVLDDTVAADQKTLQITINQYNAGFAAKADVLTAQTQLDQAKSAAVAVGISRGQYEHAIATLAGMPPAALTIPATKTPPAVPNVPISVPSGLLQRRPDIAAAERTMAANNALIGVQVAAFYPTITLSASAGLQGAAFGPLFSVANNVWSIGGTATEDIFEGGARTAAVAAARAQYENSVATYRQTVLSAFQQVEDALVALRLAKQQAEIQDQAVRDAQRALAITINEYQAGTQAYTAVVTAQNTLLSARQTALSIQEQRLTEAVTLITSLGGGWSGQLPTNL
jgi:NodT family efflux transporter outer membrane factor (OMF) lipoprotein